MRSRESSRGATFSAIADSIVQWTDWRDEQHLVAHGDALDVLGKIPSECVNLIVTDPPYHTTKKASITGDTDFASDDKYLRWLEGFVKEWRRILRPNGSLYVFCSPKMAAQIEMLLRPTFNVLASVVWTKPNDPGFDGWKQKMSKEAMRCWYPHSERIVFCEPALDGNLRRSTLGHYLKAVRLQAGLSTYDVAEAIGAYGKVNHGGSVSNWEAGRNIPSREQYGKLAEALTATGKLNHLLDYDDVVRPFNVTADDAFEDIWDFPNVRPYKGKHPAEKPIDLLRHAIEASSLPGDIVLDSCGGSGATAVAAKTLKRRSITIEIEKAWCSAAIRKLNVVQHFPTERKRKRFREKPMPQPSFLVG